jgi:beta-phosphoglucomutase-like phosphatase (HAD superfamily)
VTAPTSRQPPLAAVVFDFDGVLADSEPLHLQGLRAALATRGLDVPPADYYAHFLGFNDEDALASMAVHYGWSLTARDIAALVETKMNQMETLLTAPGVLFPEARACVRRFAGVGLAIASGAKRQEIELVLEANALAGEFDCIVASGETEQSKPSPEPYARAVSLLQELGVVASGPDVARRCVAVEDSQWGLQSARGAGLCCVAVTTSYPAAVLADADLVIASLEELTPERLSRLVEGRT